MANEITKLMVDTAVGCVEKYSASDANTAIRNHFKEVLGLSENYSAKELRRAIRKNKHEIYEIIEDTVSVMLETNWGENPFFQALVDKRDLTAGDKNEFYVPDNSVLTVAEYSGGHHDIIRQKVAEATYKQIPTSWYGIKVYEEFERFIAGRIDWAFYITKLYEGVDKKVNDMLSEAFMGLDNTVPAAFKLTGAPDVVKILDLIERVETSAKCKAMIVGPRAAITAITKLTTAPEWSDAMKDERNTLGMLGVWEGVQLMRMPQVLSDDKTKFKFDQKKLFVIPMTDEKIIKLVNEGDPIYSENVEPSRNRDMTVEAEYLFKMGVATVVGADYGTITLN